MQPSEAEIARAVGAALRAAGYADRPVARALGMLAWTGYDLDGEWWERRSLAEGRLGALVELLIRGRRLPLAIAADALPPQAWALGLIEDDGRDAWATATVLPMDGDLICTDRPERSEAGDGLFLPDSTTLALRRCLPPRRVGRHLDLGSGAGAVAVAAARLADRTLAVDLNPRAAHACLRTAALSGVEGLAAVTARVEDLELDARFDRITFVLPLLVAMPRHAGAPVHTVADRPELLVAVLRRLPELLAPGGLALLYAQEHAGDSALAEAADEAFGDRPWRGVFWWDHPGDPDTGEPRAGVLALRADAGGGLAVARRPRMPLGTTSWWPQLSEHLEG